MIEISSKGMKNPYQQEDVEKEIRAEVQKLLKLKEGTEPYKLQRAKIDIMIFKAEQSGVVFDFLDELKKQFKK